MSVIQPINSKWEEPIGWEEISAVEVRAAALNCTVSSADQTVKTVAPYAARLIVEVATLAFFAHYYTASLVANFAICRLLANVGATRPIEYVAEKTSAVAVKTALYATASFEGVNEKYRPSMLDMAWKSV